MKVKTRSEKPSLKLNIQKTKIMASGTITSWQVDGKTMDTVTDFIWRGGAPKSLEMGTDVMPGKTEGRSRRGRQRMRWLDAIMTGWT